MTAVQVSPSNGPTRWQEEYEALARRAAASRLARRRSEAVPTRRRPRPRARPGGGGGHAAGERAIPEETPIAFTYNGATYAVMMATPQDLEDFARRLQPDRRHRRVGRTRSRASTSSRTSSASSCGCGSRRRAPAALSERRRHLAGPTGCGLCGIESLAEAMRPPRVSSATASVHAGRDHAARWRRSRRSRR